MTEKDEAELEDTKLNPTWQIEFDKLPNDAKIAFWMQIHDIKSFITRKQQELVESILAEIPTRLNPFDSDSEIEDLKKLKQSIKERYAKD